MDKNVQAVHDAYAAFGRGDINAILDMCTNDINWHTFGPPELPMSGERHGKNEVKKFFEQVAAAWNFDRFEPREFYAQGDTVVALGTYTGTAKNTKRPFNAEFSHVFTFNGDKVTRFREYTDTANLIGAYSPSMSRA